MSNSKLVNYTKISPHRNSPRNHKIDKITIHHMAGNLTVEQCGQVFQTREASSNYGIDSNGRVGMYVEEKDRSWCSFSPENDNRAITIEVANDQPSDAGNWHVSDTALNKLIELCVDICQRNGIEKLNYTGNTSGNLTMHKWFAPTGCPGPYLESKFPYIAEQVNKKLKGNTAVYRVRKTWADASSQIGAYSDLAAAKAACKEGYSVFDEKGKSVYTKEVAKPATKAYQRTITMHTVKSGENLTTIAEKYKTTTDKILKYNSIPNPNKIKVGQQIKIVKDITVTSKFELKTYTTLVDLKIRNGAGSGYKQKSYSQLTTAQKKNCYKQTAAVLKSGTKVTLKKIWKISDKEWWAQTDYYYICLMANGKKYIK